MACNSCSSSVIDAVCGCGTSNCHPFKIARCSQQCPPPPPIEPCNYREEDGQRIPVWHPLHPLIPRIRACHTAMADCSGYTDEQLACELRQAEDLFSTCAYPGDRYYLAIIYQVLAVQELRQLYSAYASAQMAAIANGGSFKPCEIELCHTAHGQLLKGLDKRNAIGRVFVT